jgi:hypothetical protein
MTCNGNHIHPTADAQALSRADLIANLQRAWRRLERLEATLDAAAWISLEDLDLHELGYVLEELEARLARVTNEIARRRRSSLRVLRGDAP